MNPALWRAYRNTIYRIGQTAIQIGRRSAAADTILGRDRWLVLISAYNPRSRPMPPAWNRRMHQRLHQAARRYRPTEAVGAWRAWSEAHLALIADPRVAAVLARRFRQNAIVIVARHRPARLSATLRPPVRFS